MHALFFLIVSVAFLLTAMMVFRRRRTSVVRDAAFGVFLAGSVGLFVAYGVANYFTGAGINEAVWFHLRYGLRGAGFAAYWTLIGISGLVLVGALTFCFALSFWKRKEGGGSMVAAFVPFLLLLVSGGFNPAVSNLIHLRSGARPAAADFYDHYRRPAIKPMTARRNLVFVYAEGLERTYFDERRFPGLIRRLRQLEGQSTYFTDIRQVAATGFTMGGIVASQCGVPLFTPASGNSMAGVDLFLPGARGLGNLLHEVGYQLEFMGGAPLEFAGKGKFFHTQEFDSVEGLYELLPRLPDSSYRSPWGLHDDTLFELAFDRLTQLSADGKPFGLFLLTLDTHHPHGHISKSAEGIVYGDGSNPMLNAVAAADFVIAEFIERIRSSPLGRDTVVVLASDHLGLGNSATDLLNQGVRRNLFMVFKPNTNVGEAIDTPGSTLDTGTTLLPFLGYKGAIGLGRDLVDPATTPAELQFIQSSANLQRWRQDISAMWLFPYLNGPMRVDPDRQVVILNGREFSIPVLIKVQPNQDVLLTFPSDPTVPFLDQIRSLPTDVPFLLIDRMEHLGRIHGFGRDTGWCILTEPVEGVVKIIPVRELLSLSSDEIAMFLTDGAESGTESGLDVIYALSHRE